MKKYEKLVRTKIPEIIFQNKQTPRYDLLKGHPLVAALKAKLIEEAIEVRDAVADDEVIEELADLQTVIYELQKMYDINASDLQTVIKAKRIKRGSFLDLDENNEYVGVYLKDVE